MYFRKRENPPRRDPRKSLNEPEFVPQDISHHRCPLHVNKNQMPEPFEGEIITNDDSDDEFHENRMQKPFEEEAEESDEQMMSDFEEVLTDEEMKSDFDETAEEIVEVGKYVKNYKPSTGKFVKAPSQKEDFVTRLWVYDLESSLVLVENNRGKVRIDFSTDETGNFLLDDSMMPITYEVQKFMQVPNFVAYRNVFDLETPTKTASLKDFVHEMLTENGGKNVCLAHNGSGYDSRLVFEEIVSQTGKSTVINPIMKGSKFMRLSVGQTIFQDSMMHLIGSLKNLARDFNSDNGPALAKGYFPHLFNKADNYNYVGPLPSKRFFDLSFMVKDDKDLEEFNTWHASWDGRTDWSFKDELERYCINDVEVLTSIVRKHHYACVTVLGNYRKYLHVSPWHFPTAAGYVHRIFLRHTTETNGLDEVDYEAAHVLAQSSWSALMPEEYYFARLALRGGRTEIRKFYHDGPVGDQDVQSMYPFVQMGKDIEVNGETIPLLFPVGTPDIEVHDCDYFPCYIHWNNPTEVCQCQIAYKYMGMNRRLSVIDTVRPENMDDYLDNFFGIICCDVTPPKNLYHPVLPTYDAVNKKCLFSLEPIVRQVFTSVELNVARRSGYKVTKIYRADRYNAAPSKWRGLIGEMYKLKLYNSQPAEPNRRNIFNESTEQWRLRQIETYREKFDIDIDFDNWAKRPAMKMSGKIILNSGWGKHAESVDQPQTLILDDSMAQEDYDFYQTIEHGKNKVTQFVNLPSDRTLYRYQNNRGDKSPFPNLHKGYLPCAVFVPMYGRLLLLNELTKLGERVLMCDTDSVKYIKEDGAYTIPQGDTLGSWEDEDTDCVEFVAIGPKSYGQRFADGSELFKCKGVAIKRAQSHILNFQVAKQILIEGKVAQVPQMTFDYRLGEGISTRRFIKVAAFMKDKLKGEYDEKTTKLYPFGWQYEDEEPNAQPPSQQDDFEMPEIPDLPPSPPTSPRNEPQQTPHSPPHEEYQIVGAPIPETIVQKAQEVVVEVPIIEETRKPETRSRHSWLTIKQRKQKKPKSKFRQSKRPKTSDN